MTFVFAVYRAIPSKNKLTHDERLACETYRYHAYEVSVHSCMMSLWCTSLALLTHTPSCFPRVHSCGRLAAHWLQAQWRKVYVVMPRLAWLHRLWHGSFDMVIWVSSEGMCLSSEMIELDGDEERISSQGRYAERDIVQVQIIPRAVGMRLLAQQNISWEMCDLLIMGRGHVLDPLLCSCSQYGIFLSLACRIFPLCSLLLFHFLLSDLSISLFFDSSPCFCSPVFFVSSP